MNVFIFCSSSCSSSFLQIYEYNLTTNIKKHKRKQIMLSMFTNADFVTSQLLIDDSRNPAHTPHTHTHQNEQHKNNSLNLLLQHE